MRLKNKKKRLCYRFLFFLGGDWQCHRESAALQTGRGRADCWFSQWNSKQAQTLAPRNWQESRANPVDGYDSVKSGIKQGLIRRALERLHFPFSLSCTGEGNGNPLQCSCLENPRDGGAWWAALYGVAQSRTRLKRLSSSSSREAEVTCRGRYLITIFTCVKGMLKEMGFPHLVSNFTEL